METVSEKPGNLPNSLGRFCSRGRPKTIGLMIDFYDSSRIPWMAGPEVRTRRGRQNCAYAQTALGVLFDDPRFEWLVGTAPDWRGMKRGILSELGRLWQEELIREVALELCQRKPTRREAIAYIRRVRGVRKEPTDGTLAYRLLRAINEFIADYPDTTWQYIEEQIALADFVIKAKRNESMGGYDCEPAASEDICGQ